MYAYVLAPFLMIDLAIAKIPGTFWVLGLLYLCGVIIFRVMRYMLSSKPVWIQPWQTTTEVWRAKYISNWRGLQFCSLIMYLFLSLKWSESEVMFRHIPVLGGSDFLESKGKKRNSFRRILTSFLSTKKGLLVPVWLRQVISDGDICIASRKMRIVVSGINSQKNLIWIVSTPFEKCKKRGQTEPILILDIGSGRAR